ncbi:MAG: TetR/AcrR family transcriptional regulator [Albidovulum sp.]
MAAPEDRRKPRKTPRQGRSRATVEAILEAATRILEEEGLAGLTTNRTAERAGVSIGSLYQYYPSRDAILAELVRRMRLSMSAGLLAAIAEARPLPLHAAVPKLLRVAMQQYETAPRLTAALEAAEARLPRDREVIDRRHVVRNALIECLGRHGIENPEIAALDIFAMTKAIVMTGIAAGGADFEAICARTTRAALGYLTYRDGGT